MSHEGVLRDKEAWDQYWSKKNVGGGLLYDTIAQFYRKFIIKPSLTYFINKYFEPRAKVLHAGCGSGQVDLDIAQKVNITAMDISESALAFYRETHHGQCEVVLGSVFDIPLASNMFDGVYNLGVMEHFKEEEIHKALLEFKRVLKPRGRIVLFWPHERGTSVTFLKGVHFLLNRVLKKSIKLHPDEISRLRSRAHAQGIIDKAQLKFIDYYFGPKDLFTQAVVIAQKD